MGYSKLNMLMIFLNVTDSICLESKKYCYMWTENTEKISVTLQFLLLPGGSEQDLLLYLFLAICFREKMKTNSQKLRNEMTEW